MTSTKATGRFWVLTAAAEVLFLGLAWLCWAGGVLSGPGLASPNTPGNTAGVIVFEVLAAALACVVPFWLARRTGQVAWVALGVLPAIFALGTAVAVLRGW